MIKLRPAVYFLIPFLIGIITGTYTAIPLFWLWLFIVICLVGSVVARKRKRFLCYILLHIAVFTCGMLRLELATVPLIPPHFYDQPVSFTGKTTYQPERGEVWEACYVVGQVQLLADPSQTVSTKVLIRFDEPIPLRYGRNITLTGVLHQPDTKRNPGGFDYRAYLARQNVSGIISHQGLFRLGEQSGFPPLRWIESLRLRTERTIDDAYVSFKEPSTENASTNGLHAQLLKGILLGKRGDVPTETLDMFRNSGTFHVLAVSGLHVGLVAMFCFVAFSKFRVPMLTFRIPPKIVSLLTIVAIIIYACLVGFHPSVFRAALMASLYLFARIIDRDADIYNLLAVAALALLLINPTQVWDVGFQLSFSAVIAIVYFVPKMENPIRKLWETPEDAKSSRLARYRKQALKWLVLSYLVTFAAQIGTAPLIAYHFYSGYPLGIIVGPFAVGLVSLIVGVGMASVIVGFIILPLAKILAVVNHTIIFIFLKLIGMFGQEWGITTIAPPTLGLVAVYIALILGVTHWRFVYQQWKTASLIGLSVVAMWVWNSGFHEQGRLLEVVTLDVGQGDAAIVRFPDGMTMLIDGGIQRSYYDVKRQKQVEYDVGERVIEPYLNSNGIRELDLVVLSHPDIDHGGGLGYILKNYKVKRVIGIADMELDSQTHRRLRSIAKERGIPYSFPYAGEIDLTGTARLNLLHPIDVASTDLMDANKNADSLVIKLSYGEVDILFTGDIEAEGETRLITSLQDLRSEILKVPHHGSRTSSSAQFIDAVQPRFAIYSLGQRNQFQLPHPEVVERYKVRDCKQLRTDQLGAITVKSDGTRCWFKYTVLP